MPRGIVAQIMGHAPSATAKRHYIHQLTELLAVWYFYIQIYWGNSGQPAVARKRALMTHYGIG